MVATPRWTYMLRIKGRNPKQMQLDRLAAYMLEFAELLGLENQPKFAGIKVESTGLKALVPARRRTSTWKRIQSAKSDPRSRAARHLKAIESMLGNDALCSAELLDTSNKVIYLFRAAEQSHVDAITIKQSGEVDGVVTGVVGADDTMHLHLRDTLSRDLKLVIRDERMARGLLAHFRRGHVRVRVHGSWARTEQGWIPETNRCVVDGYEVLDDTPATEIFANLGAAVGNGWCDLEDPMQAWRELRGIH